MSDITSTPFGAAEHCRLDNWAAEYAKKLFVAEAAKRTEEITDITKSGGTIDQRITAYDSEEITDITKSGGTIDQRITAYDSEVIDPIEQDIEDLDENKVGKTDYASTEQAGVIRLHKLNSYNNSGIEVDPQTGTAYIKTSETYGTKRDGVGQIQIAAATTAEINTGTQQYKPIVPATMKAAVEKHTGAAADLPSIDGVKPANLVAAVNALSGVDDGLREAINNIVVQIADLETRESAARSNEDRLIWNTLGTSKAVRDITPIKTGEITSKGTYVVTQPTSVTDAISCISDALDYERDARMKYSTTPKRIGTWIDGVTPVWRVAYCETFDTLWTSGYRSIDIPVKNTDIIFTIHAEFSAMAAQTPCYVDDRPVEYSGGGDIIYPTGSTTQFEGFYGVLEFVTAASNISS